MSYDGRAVANYILDFCTEKNRRITNLALQKIIYFCHVWTLIELHRPLVKQDFEAWQFGPVLQHVYREFKDFDKHPINRRAIRLDRKTGDLVVVEYDFDAELTALLPRIVDFYSQMGAGDLVEISHVVGGPWDMVWNHAAPINPGMIIDNELILEFYSRSPEQFPIQ
ncbi:Panacea domain-containing protein [Dyella acidisoli]|uniref:Antitoxin SocA-like Panacea domain-containing protein n=1 Tax=Dyella acidisoli TaxID=1867834 RepID=A0ABQ5XNJ2_9GAMM|nr:type II toxin-antitoxin system antitoxin SocA domain-containing protein [Dyella acidisoli]GLQ92567.1 hypothetical protein GCM10007901_15180 [Dyella acidisoli]